MFHYLKHFVSRHETLCFTTWNRNSLRLSDYVCSRLYLNWAVIGDRSGDRLPTTYHRSKSTMNKGLWSMVIGWKRIFIFYIGESGRIIQNFRHRTERLQLNCSVSLTKKMALRISPSHLSTIVRIFAKRGAYLDELQRLWANKKPINCVYLF